MTTIEKTRLRQVVKSALVVTCAAVATYGGSNATDLFSSASEPSAASEVSMDLTQTRGMGTNQHLAKTAERRPPAYEDLVHPPSYEETITAGGCQVIPMEPPPQYTPKGSTGASRVIPMEPPPQYTPKGSTVAGDGERSGNWPITVEEGRTIWSDGYYKRDTEGKTLVMVFGKTPPQNELSTGVDSDDFSCARKRTALDPIPPREMKKPSVPPLDPIPPREMKKPSAPPLNKIPPWKRELPPIPQEEGHYETIDEYDYGTTRRGSIKNHHYETIPSKATENEYEEMDDYYKTLRRDSIANHDYATIPSESIDKQNYQTKETENIYETLNNRANSESIKLRKLTGRAPLRANDLLGVSSKHKRSRKRLKGMGVKVWRKIGKLFSRKSRKPTSK